MNFGEQSDSFHTIPEAEIVLNGQELVRINAEYESV